MEEQHFAPLFVHLHKTICMYNLENEDFEIGICHAAKVKYGASRIDSNLKAKKLLVICGK
jgi:hypothetical protein